MTGPRRTESRPEPSSRLFRPWCEGKATSNCSRISVIQVKIIGGPPPPGIHNSCYFYRNHPSG